MGNFASSATEADFKKLFKPEGGGRLREVFIKTGFVEFKRCRMLSTFFSIKLSCHKGKGPID